ncbi:hypothetical protein M427DRAFT_30513 [Gonapodya prolifera JEL478]|uniref:Uncharacterized protein n=1 Tax=Gonapodya prolifera (strain JEL478) TaxID=1344416 RepID=A0A139AKR7_GONPJ|nr:hypothetical protein M427DRAFT_30513 [Gonapodya prolifera JEL478]|eukprot:KXS17379.1 hypothetical protein M427DRAFT_30513 [Gonapodya prolifera JEL478]
MTPSRRGMPGHLNPSQMSIIICELRKRGMTPKELAQEFQVTERTIYNWNNAPLVPPPRRRNRPLGRRPLVNAEGQHAIFEWLLDDPTRRQEDAAKHFSELWSIRLSQQVVSLYMQKFDFGLVDTN